MLMLNKVHLVFSRDTDPAFVMKRVDGSPVADLVFTPGGESDVDLSLQRLTEIRRRDPAGYWVPGQFDNADNIEAHYRTTGPEIWEQTGGVIGAFVASQGSAPVALSNARTFRS